MKPEEIEVQSFKIIDAEAGNHKFSTEQWTIVRRMIHTSADFEYVQTVRFHVDAISAGITAIQNGKTIITDTNMARIGIRSYDLATFGAEVKCFMAEPDIAEIARENHTTRAVAAVDAALEMMEDGIYVVGNAPTALLHLVDCIQASRARPALVIGLPVGFVNAAESKEALMAANYPCISNTGRKGGSNVAASVVNALIKLAMGNNNR